MERRVVLGVAAILAATSVMVPPAPLSAQGVLVKGGDVIDGTGRARRRVDVRVVGETIAEMGPSLQPRAGERVIDATGKVVTPGFIDLHSHVDMGLEQAPDLESQVRQGITLAVVGNDGGGMLPVSDFFARLELARPAINVASFVGHGTVRGTVMGGDFRRRATPTEIRTMQALVGRAMRDGAIGLSSGLEYDPGFFGTTSEVAALASVIKPYGGPYFSHVRDEDHEAFAAWKEAIDVGRRAGVRVNISHIKLGVTAMWGRAAEGLGLLEQAKREGIDVTADVYPYQYWMSRVYVLLADRDLENRTKWEAGLKDIGGPGHVLISEYPADSAYNGRTLEDIARANGKDAVTMVIEMIRKVGAENIGVIVTAMDERDIETFLRHPQVLVCSDGQPGSRHPRGHGSFPRVLARYVRERQVMSLDAMIPKMTGRSAALLGLRTRGTLERGKKADLLVLDPETIQDRATPTEPHALATGITHVLVNGQIVLDDGRMTTVRPGQAVRRDNWKPYALTSSR
jgi:N-acyl-D-amino-acid deacylase